MKIITANYEILTPINKEDILKSIEIAGRICYKSTNLITNDSASKFVKMLISRDHLAMIEHQSITVKFICDRGVSHEIVRHRIASYAQESTRYCNYSKDKFGKELTFIDLVTGFHYDLTNPTDIAKWEVWTKVMNECEQGYLRMLELGAKPEEARSVLPNSLKTEIVITMNLREWRHFFKLRTAKVAHPQIREIAIPLLNNLKVILPEIFEDIIVED